MQAHVFWKPGAQIKVALEDDFGERLLARKAKIPQGTLFAD